MIKRTSKLFIDQLIIDNSSWKILDIGCGYGAHKNATTICDKLDLKEFYKDKNFLQIHNDNLPFKDKEFDFVIASHVLDHVDNIEKFISELD